LRQETSLILDSRERKIFELNES